MAATETRGRDDIVPNGTGKRCSQTWLRHGQIDRNEKNNRDNKCAGDAAVGRSGTVCAGPDRSGAQQCADVGCEVR